jgi:hypothetical protein
LTNIGWINSETGEILLSRKTPSWIMEKYHSSSNVSEIKEVTKDEPKTKEVAATESGIIYSPYVPIVKMDNTIEQDEPKTEDKPKKQTRTRKTKQTVEDKADE